MYRTIWKHIRNIKQYGPIQNNIETYETIFKYKFIYKHKQIWNTMNNYKNHKTIYTHLRKFIEEYEKLFYTLLYYVNVYVTHSKTNNCIGCESKHVFFFKLFFWA